ncbi:hypothetical protein EJ04DRAFT_515496 [Polyplosphaeria fusca]|uniref:Uncharacterized protein n=1 Tax=Polyplosphaeria fusca TaxID=682080 RepID=A0A9P4QRE9_9PLEO|nr:hypothetical protein EJ04DRAFT_515496 [Polyplosphaeria fusca]
MSALDSPLLALPAELRNEIYAWLFCSTTIQYQQRWPYDRPYTQTITVTEPNSLSLLRVNRALHTELRHAWLSLVEFSFTSPWGMLDVFTPLPRSTLSLIRHVRVWEGGIVLNVLQRGGGGLRREARGLPWALDMLVPALRLDVLTVVGAHHHFSDENDYKMAKLVRESRGWKVLQFHSTESIRLPNPGFWTKVLVERDGEGKGAEAVVYSGFLGGFSAGVYEPDQRQTITGEDDTVDFMYMDDVAGPNVASLAVFRRGRDADIAGEAGAGARVEGETWAVIKERHGRGGC